MDLADYLLNALFVQVNPSTALAVDALAGLASAANWPADGFRLSYSDQAAQAQHHLYLAIKGR